jgi:hypothetical protein
MPFYKGRNWKSLPDSELVWAHWRIHQAWGLYQKYGKYNDYKGNSWSKEDFYNQHKLIYDEMKRRGMNVDPNDPMLRIGPHPRKQDKWDDIHIGPLKEEDIERCVRDRQWQKFREGLEGLPLYNRYERLKCWFQSNTPCAKIQVTNYINALRRSGLLEGIAMDKPKKLMMFLVGAEKKPIADLADGVMISAVQIKSRNMLMPWLDTYKGKIMMDNGIFSNIVMSVEELAQRVNSIEPHIVCGPDVLFDHEIHLKSLKRQKQFMAQHLPKSTEVMLIPQGNTCLEYEWCIGEIIKMNPDWIGLGRMSMKVAGYPGKGHQQRVYCLRRLEELELIDKIKSAGIKMHALGVSKPFEFRYFNRYGFSAFDSMSYIYASLFNQLVYPLDSTESQFHLEEGVIKRKAKESDELYNAKMEFAKSYPWDKSLEERQIWIVKNIWRPMMEQHAQDKHVERLTGNLLWDDRDDTPMLIKPGTEKIRDAIQMNDSLALEDLKTIDIMKLDSDYVRSYHLIVHNAWNKGTEKMDVNELRDIHDRIVERMQELGISHQSPLVLEDSLAEVRSSGHEIGNEVNLQDVLKHFEDFRVSWPHVYLTGGIVNRGKTKGDIDILIRTVKNDPMNVPIMFRILRMLPPELSERVQFLFEDTTEKFGHVPGPYTNHVPLYGVQLHTLKPFSTVEMEAKVSVGKFFTPLKPTIGYKVGVVYGWDALARLVDEDMYPVVIQKKYDGARIQIHKKGEDIKIFSDDGHRIEHRLPSFVEELQKDNWPSEVILDAECEMWIRGKHQGREIVSGFLRKGEKLFKGEDGNLVVNVFDVLYEKESLADKPLGERQSILDKLPLKQSTDRVPRTGEFNRTPSYVAKNDGDMIRFAKKVTTLPGSEGAMVKSIMSKYELDGQTSEWFKYKKTVEFVVAAIEKIETKTPGVYNYRMGVNPKGMDIAESDIKTVDGHKYAYVGKTMNTTISVPIGTSLRVSAENVFLYHDKLRLYLPIVLEAKSNDKVYDVTTTIDVAREAGLLQEKEMQTEWPSEQKKHKFVIQHHFRGKSVHTDFRCQVNDELEGWTIFSQPPGVVKQEPDNKQEAKRIADNIKWKWPKTDVHAQAGPKSPQPVEWLKVEGKFDPGEVGATREKPGYMLIEDKGEVEFGARKPYFYEYFLHGTKTDGRLIFRYIPRQGLIAEVQTEDNDNHFHTVKIDEKGNGKTTVADNHFHEVVKWEIQREQNHVHTLPWSESPIEQVYDEDLRLQRETGFWNTWLPEDEEPYVLSRGAVNDNWIPPQGISALPKLMRDKIPSKYQYWHPASRTERIRIRNELRKAKEIKFKVKQKYDEHHYLLEKDGDHYLGTAPICKYKEGDEATWACFENVVEIDLQRNSFVLQHHWWKGQAVIRAGPSVEHWDLFILPQGDMYVLNSNPLEGPTNVSTRRPYSKAFWEKGARGPEAIKPGEPGNPTKNTPAWIEMIDKGEVGILEDGNLFKRFNFHGKQLKSTYTMKREDANINLWVFEKAQMPGEKLQQLQKVVLQAGQCVKQQNVYLSIEKFGKYGDKFVVTGTALSYGVWNGDWYPPQVLDDRPERVLNIPLGVGSHKDKDNHGKVIDFEYDNENHTIKVAVEVTSPEKQLEVENGDYVGFSVEITVLSDDIRHIIEKIVSYDRVCLVKNPACEVCTIERIEGKAAGRKSHCRYYSKQ